MSWCLAGYQSALVAPTEILAQQHYSTVADLISKCSSESRPTAALLTSSTKTPEREEILQQLASGEIHLLVGTHSLFGKNVLFERLALVVVDEQHKFGVDQRQSVKAMNDVSPHLLMMSATPIPRSLALIVYGTVSVSTIKTKLTGRQKVETHIVYESDDQGIDTMYLKALQEVEAGGQVYIVFPTIVNSEAKKFADLKSATEQYDILQRTRFAGCRCGLVHGRLSGEEKSAAFKAFARGETQVLISTTVIEVGMDVHRASMIIIHHPERSGLAQLHQLRGRVGRGQRPSTCYLVPSGKNTEFVSLVTCLCDTRRSSASTTHPDRNI